MEQLVRVQKRNEDGTAQVICVCQSACTAGCNQCTGCGALKQTRIFTAQNPIGAKPGELVTVRSGSGPVLAAAVLYMMPLWLFFLGYALGAALWQRGRLAGCLCLAVGIVLAAAYDRRMAKNKKTVYTITGFGHFQPEDE